MKGFSKSNLPSVGCIYSLVVGLAVVTVLVITSVREGRKPQQEYEQRREEYRETLAQIQRFGEAHQAFGDLKSVYKRCLPDEAAFEYATSLERERAAEKLAETITSQSMLFYGTIDDVLRRDNQYVLLLEHADSLCPFDADLTCSRQLADKVLSEREDSWDLFAAVVKISRIQPESPAKGEKLRFVLMGECEDVLLFDDYRYYLLEEFQVE